jgi:predicted nucleic acid-binding protein
MDKPRIYLESSVVSYLANRPSRDVRTALRQLITNEWWESIDRSTVWVSKLVIDEVSKGNHEAAQRRLKVIDGLPIFDISQEAMELAAKLIRDGAVPKTEPEDATHIAPAVTLKARFLVTWNFSHFVGPTAKWQLMRVLESWAYDAPYLVTPEEMIEGQIP